MAVTRDPIFVARQICDFDFRTLHLEPELRKKIHTVILGQEQVGGGCSMNTKVILVEPNEGFDLDPQDLEDLRRELLQRICQPASGGRTV